MTWICLMSSYIKNTTRYKVKKMDLMNGMKILDKNIDFWIKYILSQKEAVDEGDLCEFTFDIIDEWIVDMDIYMYIYDELKTRLHEEGIKVLK